MTDTATVSDHGNCCPIPLAKYVAGARRDLAGHAFTAGHDTNIIHHLLLEVDRLRQGLWDVYGVLGFDQDGDPTPDHLVYPDLVTLVIDAAKEFRADYEQGQDESGSKDVT